MNVKKLVFLDIITLGLYAHYWKVQTAKNLSLQDEKKPSVIFTAVVGFSVLLQLMIFFAPDKPEFLWQMNAILFILIMSANFWLAKKIEENRKTSLENSKILRNLAVFVFGSYYLQYSLNRRDYPSQRRSTPSMLAAGFAIAVTSLAITRIFVFNWYNLPTKSMMPTLFPEDRVLVYRLAYHDISDIKVGDLVVFIDDKGVSLVKRVVAVPNDVINFYENEVTRNQRQLAQEQIGSSSVYWERNGDASYLINLEDLTSDERAYSYTVPSDSVFVVGDNRSLSLDSRHFGPVLFSRIRGKVIRVIYSAWDMNLKDGSAHKRDAAQRFWFTL